ncbi:MAG: glutathione transferase GstA [Methylococcus sp.]|jgi:glutathione S-transferase|nr:MAG: glutathione transferase GstA [Methylococcus sp.]
MKFYYTPGACSLASHIVLREAGYGFGLVKVDLATHKTEHGDDFLAINPKGYVPALQFLDGSVLTENQVILQYLADHKPQAGLAPETGTMARYRLMEWLAFIATELHKGFGPLWNPNAPTETRQAALDQLSKRFDFVEKELGNQHYLTGEHFTIVDAYLFTVLSWCAYHHIDLSPWPRLAAFQKRVAERPAVAAALHAEGLAGE